MIINSATSGMKLWNYIKWTLLHIKS
jgi:hypothetical protein